MGDGVELLDLFALAGDELLNQGLGEYAACGEEVVIALQSVQSITQVGGQMAELCLLLVAEMVEVDVVGPQPFA